MQTLPSGQYEALDDTFRKPCAKVIVQQGATSIPFAGKIFTPQTANEYTPESLNHVSGRYCLVFIREVDIGGSSIRKHLFFKNTDTTKNTWNSGVDLTAGGSHYQYDHNDPCLVAIGSANIGIIVERSGALYSTVVTAEDGSEVTALSSISTTGDHATITKTGATYWLMYQRSGVLYYKTSSDFITWSSESNFNTETGLSNDHDYPSLYVDTSAKLWVVFERVSDTTVNPEIKNIYFMTSTNNGSTWSSPSAITTLVAGDGQALKPSIIDTATYRWISYTLKRTVQNLQYDLGNAYNPRMFQLDNVNNRIGMIAGVNVNDSQLVIYDKDTGLYVSHDLDIHGMTGGQVSGLGYDEVNQIWAIGTSGDGIIVFNEGTTTWKQYNETSTPAIADERMTHDTTIKVLEGKIYFQTGLTSGNYHYILDPVADSLVLLGNYNNGNISTLFSQVEVNDTYIVFIQRTYGTSSPSGRVHPRVRVYSKATNALLYHEFMGDGSAYDLWHYPGNVSVATFGKGKMGWDGINNKIYCIAQPTASTQDNGIICYTVGSSGLTFDRYISQANGNSAGLLPHPDNTLDKMSITNWLDYNETNQRLYIQTYTTSNSSGGIGRVHYSVLNTNSDQVINYYARIDSTEYAVNFPSFDALLEKVLLNGSITSGVTWALSDDDKNLIYHSTMGAYNKYYWHILTTEGASAGIQYVRSTDDSTWTSEASLTRDAQDDFIHLEANGNSLVGFWQRPGSSYLYWDEDLSGEINVSEYVENFTITMTDETGSNSANITLADKEGLFNPLNYNSLKKDYFAENNIIKIEKGNNNNYTPAFYGLIATGEASYVRGSEILYNLTVYDRSKNWFKKKITTSFYQDQTVSAIVLDVITNYGGLTAPDYDLPTITETIPKVQFIEEYIMDVLYKLYQAYGYFPYFDESGILRAREINQEASVDYTYYEEGTDTVDADKAPALNIVEINHRWTDDELVNKVTVIGQTKEPVETVFPEEFMGFIQGSAGWFSKSNDFTFYFSEDKTLLAESPRLSVKDSCGNSFFGGGESLSTVGSGKQNRCVVSQYISNLTRALYALIAGALVWTVLIGFGVGTTSTYNGLAPVLAIVISILGQVGSFYYELYARPVGEPAPESIVEVATNALSIAEYGEIPLEIDNPFLDTDQKCRDLANFELNKSQWFRNLPEVVVLANMAHQTQDIINVYSPVTNVVYKMYIREIQRQYKRGQQDIDVLTCALVE